MGSLDWMQEELSKEFTRQVKRIAEQLRDTAERIDRSAGHIPKSLTDDLPDHNTAASNVLSAIGNFHGNLSISGLLRAAAEADRFARTPQELQ